MKKSHLWAVLAAVLLSSYLSSAALAQAPARPAGGPSIALLDVSYIFKNHARFKGMMEDMKADVERAENQVKAERDAITKLNERCRSSAREPPTTSRWKKSWPSGRPTWPCRCSCRRTSSCNAKPRSTTPCTRRSGKPPITTANRTASTWCCGSTATRSTSIGRTAC